MSMNDTAPVGKCPLCEINLYDRGKLNKPFEYIGKQKMGYPNDVAMPCGLNYIGIKDVDVSKQIRCPFETEKEQDEINKQKAVGIFSGKNNWE